jgi:hypothetical protein
MKYTEQAAHALHSSARQYNLSGAELLADYGAVVRDCNGIGADWMPDCMTALCTKLNGVMEVPAAIHDRRYILNVDRLAADTEFLSNCMTVIEHDYAWWNPMRYIMRRRAARYYSYLRMFGGHAWEEAKKK